MQRRLLLICFASLAFLACSKTGDATPKGETKSELRPLTVDQVAARITASDGKTFIYDNNPKEMWVQGHVPGAKWLDDENVTAADLPADKTSTLIFYCHNET